MRTVTGPTDHVVVVGAGLGGLSAALRLAGAGRRVTVLEREAVPGGRAGLLERRTATRFDTGPTVLTMPDLIADALDCVGESMADWLTCEPVVPLYRAQLRRRLDARRARRPSTRWPPRSRRSAGRARPPATGGSSTSCRELYRLEMRDFIDRNIDSPLDLLRPYAGPAGGARRLPAAGAEGGAVPARRRAPSGCSPSRRCTPGCRRTTRSRSTRSSPTWTRWPACSSRAAACTRCRGRWPARRRSTASSSATAPTVTRVELRGGRAVAVHTTDGERVAVRRGGAQPGPAGRAPRPAAARAACGGGCATRRRASCCWPARRAAYPDDRAPQHLTSAHAWQRGLRRASSAAG